MTVLIMFVPPRTNRNWMCWFKNGPKFLYVVVHINFIIIPALSILWWFAMWRTTVGLCLPSQECPGSELSAWFMTYALMCILMMSFQFLIVKMIIETVKEQYAMEDDEEIERVIKIENEDLVEDEMADDAYDPFE